jgi:hypothetical protein
MLVLLDVNPVLAGFGQLAAIIICLFALIFIVIAVAFNAALALGTGWLREKANLIKMLRPTVDSVNKTSEAAMQGHTPSQDGNAIIRNIAKVPQGVQVADKKVDEATGKVAKAVIEFHARSVQVQTVAKALLFPHRTVPAAVSAEDEGLQFKSPGYRELMQEKAPLTTVETDNQPARGTAVTASQLSQDASIR